jgi:hypothetical protein
MAFKQRDESRRGEFADLVWLMVGCLEERDNGHRQL